MPSPTRRALVTGGMSGIGRAGARRLGDDGHEVITLDLAEGADVRLDVSDAAGVARAAEEIGPIDILVNSAGVVVPNRPLWETTHEEWVTTFGVNTLGIVSLCRAFVPGMRESPPVPSMT